MTDDATRKALALAFLDVDDHETAISAVGHALEILADLTERDEPYATRSINEMRAAAGRVFDLINAMENP